LEKLINTLKKLFQVHMVPDLKDSFVDEAGMIHFCQEISMNLYLDIQCYVEMETFKKLTREECVGFVLLHEVGHIMTMDDFSEEEWNTYHAERMLQSLSTREYSNFEHWSHPCEKAAMDWAIEHIHLLTEERR